MALQRCQKHPAEVINSVCLTHYEVTCIKCVLDDHRDCSEVTTFTDAVGSIREKKDRCLQQSRKMQAIISKRSAEIQTILDDIDSVKCQLERQILSVYRKLQARLDDLKSASLHELRALVVEKKQGQMNSMEKLIAVKNKLDKSVTNLELRSITDINKENLSMIQLTEQLLTDMEKSKDIGTQPAQPPFCVEFKTSVQLENILTSDLNKLGMIHRGEQDIAANFSNSVNISSDADVPSNASASMTTPTDISSTSNFENESRAEATFSYTINNISRLKGSTFSPECMIRNLPWKIMARRSEYGQKSLGFFLQCNTESDSTSWSCNASAELKVLNQKPGRKDFIRKTQHLFNSKENDWGYGYFILWNDLMDSEKGYVKDDTVTLEVHVIADSPHEVR